MTSTVIVASPDETVGEVRERMTQHDIGALPVVDAHDVLIGIVTSEDLLADYETTIPISRLMSAPVHTLPPDTAVREAARRMRLERHHHVVVIEDDKVVGVLSSFDLLRLLEVQGT